MEEGKTVYSTERGDSEGWVETHPNTLLLRDQRGDKGPRLPTTALQDSTYRGDVFILMQVI